MNVKIEKTVKVKAFEPCQMILELSSIEEARILRSELIEANDIEDFEILNEMKILLDEEFKKQGFLE